MTKTQANRLQRLLPNGEPKYVHCYDSGENSGIDRYMVVFTGNYAGRDRGYSDYVAMSAYPFHPQGFGQHGQAEGRIDANKGGYAPQIGKKNHLGKRISFSDLPEDCKKLVLRDYSEMWKLEISEI